MNPGYRKRSGPVTGQPLLGSAAFLIIAGPAATAFASAASSSATVGCCSGSTSPSSAALSFVALVHFHSWQGDVVMRLVPGGAVWLGGHAGALRPCCALRPRSAASASPTTSTGGSSERDVGRLPGQAAGQARCRARQVDGASGHVEVCVDD